LRIASKFKWLGLLGFIMFFSNWHVWKLFWLFWIFAIVEMLMISPLLVQSLQQIIGIVIAEVNNKPAPDKDNFIPKVKYSLPFHGNG